MDVVKVINDTFQLLNRPVMTADELLDAVKDDPKVWSLYARGFTMGLNQTEQKKTTERVMRLRPQNVVELAAFVAAIRPGAKTLVEDYVSRTYHSYGIKAMDDLLKLRGATGVTGESAFLFYDEQILTLAQAAGIEPADAYALTKAIKKKKHDKVAAYRDKFVPGFVRYLHEQQGTEAELAEKTAGDVWQIIMDSASYLFCAAHAYAMAVDSLYGAWLKANAPYEFYTVLLKLYTEKGDQEKISRLAKEMDAYAGIRLTAGKFGQDNRDWYADREKHTISQSLSSIKYVPKGAADVLYELGQKEYASFVDLLRTLQMETFVNARQIDALIMAGYFDRFGGRKKLQKLAEEFRDGKNRMTKTLKKWEPRLETLRNLEKDMPDEELPVSEVASAELDLLGMCVSFDDEAPDNEYIVTEVDDKYSVRATLYSLKRGTSGTLRVRKSLWEKNALKQGDIVTLNEWSSKPKYVFANGKRVPSEERELWMEGYTAHPTTQTE